MLDTKELFDNEQKARKEMLKWENAFPSVFQIEFSFTDSMHQNIHEKRNIISHDQEKAADSFVRQCVPPELRKYLHIVSLQYICKVQLVDEAVHKGLYENWKQKIGAKKVDNIEGDLIK